MSEKKPLELKAFSNYVVETLGTLKTPVSCNDWKIPEAKLTVVTDGFRPILERDLFDQLGITVSQMPCPKNEVKTIEVPCAIKQSLAKEPPELISRIGEKLYVKNRTFNSKFLRN